MNAITPAPLDFVDVTPILPSLDFEQTRAFFTSSLGFKVIEPECESYLTLGRGRIALMFWRCDDPVALLNSSVMLRVEDVGQLRDEFTGRGITCLPPLRGAGEVSDSDDRHFHISDPHGNLLMFVERRQPHS